MSNREHYVRPWMIVFSLLIFLPLSNSIFQKLSYLSVIANLAPLCYLYEVRDRQDLSINPN